MEHIAHILRYKQRIAFLFGYFSNILVTVIKLPFFHIYFTLLFTALLLLIKCQITKNNRWKYFACKFCFCWRIKKIFRCAHVPRSPSVHLWLDFYHVRKVMTTTTSYAFSTYMLSATYSATSMNNWTYSHLHLLLYTSSYLSMEWEAPNPQPSAALFASAYQLFTTNSFRAIGDAWISLIVRDVRNCKVFPIHKGVTTTITHEDVSMRADALVNHRDLCWRKRRRKKAKRV